MQKKGNKTHKIIPQYPIPIAHDELARLQILTAYRNNTLVGPMYKLNFRISDRPREELWTFSGVASARDVILDSMSKFENKFNYSFNFTEVYNGPGWICSGTCIKKLVKDGELKYTNDRKDEACITKKGLLAGRNFYIEHMKN